MKKDFDFEYFKPVPDKPGYVTHDRYCTYDEFYEALKAYLQTLPYPDNDPQYSECSLYDTLDYMLIDDRDKANDQIPSFRWLYCWPTRGGSEGFYFHIEACGDDGKSLTPKPAPLMLAKTLYENTGIALTINTAINRFIIETLDH